MAHTDIEKDAGVGVITTPFSPRDSMPFSSTMDQPPMSPLDQYKLMVGDIYAPAPTEPSQESFYHEIVAEERKAKFMYFFSGLLFFIMIAAQIVLCLGISIGAQMHLTRDTISILAAVNTGVAAVIAVLKGLGLPEKKAVERNALRKAAEKIRATTKKLMSGVQIDAVKAADEVIRMEEEAVEKAHVNLAGNDASTSGGHGKK